MNFRCGKCGEPRRAMRRARLFERLWLHDQARDIHGSMCRRPDGLRSRWRAEPNSRSDSEMKAFQSPWT